ncbi:MAG: hypothetical protein EPO68_13320 [Planctomycetota bacterium]|nr:MAG: hypothetical protein EPO68_13320 [Planctomycetota bacterium]
MLPRSLGSLGAFAALALCLASCAGSGARPRLLQSSVHREGDRWIAAGRVHGDTSAHAAARELVIEVCDAAGRTLATASTRAELAPRTSPRVAHGWDGSFRVALPAAIGSDPVAVRVRTAGASQRVP